MDADDADSDCRSDCAKDYKKCQNKAMQTYVQQWLDSGCDAWIPDYSPYIAQATAYVFAEFPGGPLVQVPVPNGDLPDLEVFFTPTFDCGVLSVSLLKAYTSSCQDCVDELLDCCPE